VTERAMIGGGPRPPRPPPPKYATARTRLAATAVGRNFSIQFSGNSSYRGNIDFETSADRSDQCLPECCC
jgi:hypothetical protein